jgi:DNA-binding transcriptional MocR family regulator
MFNHKGHCLFNVLFLFIQPMPQQQEKKTAKEWFKDLPFQQNINALRNTPYHQLDVMHYTLQDALRRSFIWDDTKEGFQYWSEIYNRIVLNNSK